LYRSYRLANQDRNAYLYLLLITTLAIVLAGCASSAGSRTIAERNAELVCVRGEAKVCHANGATSGIPGDTGACHCAPLQNIVN